MIILIDIDSTITNFGEVLLSSLSNTHSYSQITTYDWFYKNFKNPFSKTNYSSFWDSVKVNPKCIPIIHSWVRKGHIIRFVTASHFNNALGHKIQTTLSAFDQELVTEKNFIVAQDKSLIKGDVMIDDCLENLYSFNGTRICLAQPWNETNDKNIYRTDNWEKIDNLIQLKDSIVK